MYENEVAIPTLPDLDYVLQRTKKSKNKTTIGQNDAHRSCILRSVFLALSLTWLARPKKKKGGWGVSSVSFTTGH